MVRTSFVMGLLIASVPMFTAAISALAADQASVLVQPTPAVVAAMPVVEAPPAVVLPVVSLTIPCCPQPKITYKHHILGSHKFKCTPKGEMVLQVKVPCECCTLDIPVCLPCCCEGAPEVCCKKGILGREVVEYKWCCGFKVKIIFDRCGDVVVHYHGG